MKGFVAILSGCAMLLHPASASAQKATLEICNNGPIPVNVAYAARIQLFITGYKWKTTGWYVVDAGKCGVVYDEDYDDAGPYTPQSGARVVFAAIANGTWRVYHDNKVRKSGWMQSGTGQICVKLSDKAGFKFDEPAGDPAANCSGGTLVPVAQDFMPDGPGKFTYTMDWDGEVASVAVGKVAPSSNVASANSANTPVDSGNSVSAQFLRYLEQAARDSAKRANAQPGSDASDASSRADTLRVVRGDLLAYVNASQTGFEAYKTGDVQLSQGLRMWTSSEKPSLATGCWVIQGATTSTFSCVIPVSANTERLNYTQLTDAVTASLPQGWSLVSGPPFAINLPSTGYRSSSGAHGEIWLSETTDGGYNLNFQLVSAPTASQAAKPADDDPIGEGGFITPPTPPAPPAPPRY